MTFNMTIEDFFGKPKLQEILQQEHQKSDLLSKYDKAKLIKKTKKLFRARQQAPSAAQDETLVEVLDEKQKLHILPVIVTASTATPPVRIKTTSRNETNNTDNTVQSTPFRSRQQPQARPGRVSPQSDTTLINNITIPDVPNKRTRSTRVIFCQNAAAMAKICGLAKHEQAWLTYIKHYGRGHFNLSNPPPPPPKRQDLDFFTAPHPPKENARLKSTEQYYQTKNNQALLQSLQKLARYCAVLGDASSAYISFVRGTDEETVATYKCSSNTTNRMLSIGAHNVLTPQVLAIPDTQKDWRFGTKCTTKSRFYAGAPLIDKNGYIIGVVACCDEQPKPYFSLETQRKLEDLSRLIMYELDLAVKEEQRRKSLVSSAIADVYTESPGPIQRARRMIKLAQRDRLLQVVEGEVQDTLQRRQPVPPPNCPLPVIQTQASPPTSSSPTETAQTFSLTRIMQQSELDSQAVSVTTEGTDKAYPDLVEAIFDDRELDLSRSATMNNEQSQKANSKIYTPGTFKNSTTHNSDDNNTHRHSTERFNFNTTSANHFVRSRSSRKIRAASRGQYGVFPASNHGSRGSSPKQSRSSNTFPHPFESKSSLVTRDPKIISTELIDVQEPKVFSSLSESMWSPQKSYQRDTEHQDMAKPSQNSLPQRMEKHIPRHAITVEPLTIPQSQYSSKHTSQSSYNLDEAEDVITPLYTNSMHLSPSSSYSSTTTFTPVTPKDFLPMIVRSDIDETDSMYTPFNSQPNYPEPDSNFTPVNPLLAFDYRCKSRASWETSPLPLSSNRSLFDALLSSSANKPRKRMSRVSNPESGKPLPYAEASTGKVPTVDFNTLVDCVEFRNVVDEIKALPMNDVVYLVHLKNIGKENPTLVTVAANGLRNKSQLDVSAHIQAFSSMKHSLHSKQACELFGIPDCQSALLFPVHEGSVCEDVTNNVSRTANPLFTRANLDQQEPVTFNNGLLLVIASKSDGSKFFEQERVRRIKNVVFCMKTAITGWNSIGKRVNSL